MEDLLTLHLMPLQQEYRACLTSLIKILMLTFAAMQKAGKEGSDLPFVAVANKIHGEPDDEWR
jgi:hypothetical protein